MESRKKIEQAETYLKENKYNQAIGLLREIHEACPEEESVLLMLAWAYYDSGDIEQALHCFHHLFEIELRRKVFTGFAYDELVRIYKQEKKYYDLVKICEKAVAAQNEDKGLLIELGNAYLQAGRAREACAVYEKIIETEKDDAALYCLWGEALFADGFFAESEGAFAQAGKTDPEQEEHFYFKLAVLFQKAQKHQDAIRLAQKCIAQKQDNPLYYCFLGDSYIGLQELEKAFAAYEEAAACADSKSKAFYYHRLGTSLLKARFFAEAARYFQIALDFEDNPACVKGLIYAYQGMGREDKAQEVIRARQK
ncbi:MAG TPA: tetratricopeptide repeat protein [Smithellaceae bacterium]|nr:tetratricopeptide repeat protein [Smithellaceae bacterium]HRS88804.1 tetratricopeptide repeat protein [Smithellaceae bacterium]HRV25760.1 tetratricopeptide repeat protein [Smithellaceae bacterium]